MGGFTPWKLCVLCIFRHKIIGIFDLHHRRYIYWRTVSGKNQSGTYTASGRIQRKTDKRRKKEFKKQGDRKEKTRGGLCCYCESGYFNFPEIF